MTRVSPQFPEGFLPKAYPRPRDRNAVFTPTPSLAYHGLMDKRPTKPPRKCPNLRRPKHIRDAAISAEIDALAAAATSTPPPLSPDDLRSVCDLLDAAAPLIPAPPAEHSAPGLAGLTAKSTAHGDTDLCTISAPHNTDTFRDSDGFLAWVAAKPNPRARVAHYLALVAQSGKLAASMQQAGVSIGLLGAIQQRFPLIHAALGIIRRTQARQLLGMAGEVVGGIMSDDTKEPETQLKAASIAYKYAASGASGVDSAGPGGPGDGPGGVRIVINLGQQPAQPRRIAPDDVRMVDQDAVFIAGVGK